jgi:MoxR-like ATPase
MMHQRNDRHAVSTLMERILYEIKKIVVGQDRFLERVLVAILAQGHLLVEGVPGLAKTLTIKTLARTIRGTFRRIQFTPDLVPADLVGTRIYNQKTGEFTTALGPVFTHLLLADEINRAPAKVQSALLEVMQEYQVTIAGETHRVPQPFLVMATQNPIETEGTYPLPEAQVDRFMMKVLVGYPSEEEEFVIVNRVTGPENEVAAVATTEQLQAAAARVPRRFRGPGARSIRGAACGRHARPGPLRHSRPGGLPLLRRQPPRAHPPDRGRAGPGLMRGRSYVLPEDVTDLVADVFRHRLVLSYQALADAVTADAIIHRSCSTPRLLKSRWRPMSEQLRDPEKILLRLEWTVIRRLDGLLHGDYRSLFRGFGVDLADLREYQITTTFATSTGTSRRRLQTPYVRVYNEDREVTAWFLLDFSPSVSFGSEGCKSAPSRSIL